MRMLHFPGLTKFCSILTTATVLLASCSCSKEDDPAPPVEKGNLILSFKAYTNGEEIVYNKEFDDALGRKMRISFLKHYLSNVALLKSEKATNILDVALITYEDAGITDEGDSLQRVSLQVPIGSYTGLRLGIGLDAEADASDPSTFPPDHPLSAAQATYWDSWSIYRYVMIEGRIDTDGDSILTDIFGYHTGFEECYRERSFEKSISVEKGKTTEIVVSFEVNEIFFGEDTVDIATENSFHGELELIDVGIRLSDNLIRSLEIE